jgi:hypothetical protein
MEAKINLNDLAKDLAFYRISYDGSYRRDDIVEEDEYGNVSLTKEGLRLYKIHHHNYMEILKTYVQENP